jgi:hypothetical protein
MELIEMCSRLRQLTAVNSTSKGLSKRELPRKRSAMMKKYANLIGAFAFASSTQIGWN